MAQKASPYAIRVGYNQEWNNYYFPRKGSEKLDWLKRDKLIRDYLNSTFPDASRLKIEYTSNSIFVYLYIPEISLVLGKDNEKLDKILKDIYTLINDNKVAVKVNLIEVEKSLANLIASQLKKRLRSRQIVKGILTKIREERKLKGVKIELNGRLDGSDIANCKKEFWGRMPISGIDSNIELEKVKAVMSYGVIGIKVWTYKGKIWQKRNHDHTQKN